MADGVSDGTDLTCRTRAFIYVKRRRGERMAGRAGGQDLWIFRRDMSVISGPSRELDETTITIALYLRWPWTPVCHHKRVGATPRFLPHRRFIIDRSEQESIIAKHRRQRARTKSRNTPLGRTSEHVITSYRRTVP